jgi:hypothetical protein
MNDTLAGPRSDTPPDRTLLYGIGIQAELTHDHDRHRPLGTGHAIQPLARNRPSRTADLTASRGSHEISYRPFRPWESLVPGHTELRSIRLSAAGSTPPAPERDTRPDELHYPERPGALEEAVGGGGQAGSRKGQHGPRGALLKGVEDEHRPDRECPEHREEVHRPSLWARTGWFMKPSAGDGRNARGEAPQPGERLHDAIVRDDGQ